MEVFHLECHFLAHSFTASNKCETVSFPCIIPGVAKKFPVDLM